MPQAYRFGNAELLTVQRHLLVDGRPTAIGSRAFDVLVALIERRDRAVTKNELLDIAWPGLVVEENNLAAQMSALRKVLGASTFATIPGIGYRFCAPIEGDPPPIVAAASRVATRATNLPAATEALIGRDDDLAAVATMLEHHRLVTLVGPGGIGKTRLAQELARSQLARFAQGVWWVDLATVPAKELIVPAIAHAAGLAPGVGDPIGELARSIGESRMLLVLDNCEYVAQHTAHVVRSLLAIAPAVRVLATSQELLKVPGEFAYALEGLAVASAAETLDAARACGALQLLEQRARAVDARYRLADAKVPLALELCRSLDGMALAIEMAAARVPLMGLDMLVARLGERLELLRSADRGAAARYRTMRATLEWSYSLLTPLQQSVLLRLSVFVGSFRLDAAQRVASAGELDEWEVLEAISALVEKSLVKVEDGDPPRYRLLETLRIFGMESLEAKGELELAIRAHAAAMAALAAEVFARFDVENEEDCVRRHGADYDDLLAAWDRGCARGDPEMAAGTLMALTSMDCARGSYQPAWLDKATAHAMALRAGPLARAQLWYGIALLRYSPGVSNLEASRSHVAAWRAVGDRRHLFEALGDLAENLAAARCAAEAEDALAEMRELRDPAWTAQMRLSYHWPATVAAAYGGDMKLLGSRLDDQERAAREAGSFRREVESSWQRVGWAVGSGDIQLALKLSLVAVSKAEEFGHPQPITRARLAHCCALLLSGSVAKARAALRECLATAGPDGFLGCLLDAFALYAARENRPAQSARLLGFADACYGRIDQVRGPLEARMASEALEEISRGLDKSRIAQWRAAESGSSRPEALALAEEVLAASPPGSGPM